MLWKTGLDVKSVPMPANISLSGPTTTFGLKGDNGSNVQLEAPVMLALTTAEPIDANATFVGKPTGNKMFETAQ